MWVGANLFVLVVGGNRLNDLKANRRWREFQHRPLGGVPTV